MTLAIALIVALVLLLWPWVWRPQDEGSWLLKGFLCLCTVLLLIGIVIGLLIMWMFE